MKGRGKGFTLAEVMIAILFISIALFGYMSLHIRLMHSGEKLEQRQTYREQVGNSLAEAILAVKAGSSSLPDEPSLPAGIKHVEAQATWTDRNGVQTCQSDTYEYRRSTGW